MEAHAHWVEHFICGWFCSNCDYYIDDCYGDKPTRICPRCNAIMDEPMTEQTKSEWKQHVFTSRDDRITKIYHN